MAQKKWKVQEVPGYKVDWYVVYELKGTKLEVVDYENIRPEKINEIYEIAINIFHDLKSISEKELRAYSAEKRQLDVVVKAEGGYISMSFVADSVLVMAGLKKVE
ncbi:hypothetical protein [Ignicoccus hospitalis]|nr:hypothetical protein [Ignicoccus hospitalis]HIH89919.1 hypothetical protein [Desulfurococcaceae archaeon]